MYKTARNWIVLVLTMWAAPAWAYFGVSNTGQSWGNSSVADNYYYGENHAFGESNVHLFQSTQSAMQNMGSTSAYTYNMGMFSTAATEIIAGSTIAALDEEQVRTAIARMGPPPPVVAPIGDGWDVILLLVLLAVGYGVYVYRKRNFITL